MLRQEFSSCESVPTANTDVAYGLRVLNTVSQEVQPVFKSSSAWALVRPVASVEVPVADDERGLPQDSAALPARVRRLGAPAAVHAFHQSQAMAVILKHG